MSEGNSNVNVVVVMQEENWEDDGGAHDPALISLTPAEFLRFQAAAEASSAIDSDEADALEAIIHNAACPSLPCTVHAVLNIWHRSG